MIIGVEQEIFMALILFAFAGAIISVVLGILIMLGGSPARTFIKAGLSKKNRVLIIFGKDRSAVFALAKSVKDGLVSKVHGAYGAANDSMYLAGNRLVTPVYSPFGITWNADVVAFINWVKRTRGKKDLDQIMQEVGIWQTVGGEKVFAGIDKKKAKDLQYNPEAEIDLISKKHGVFMSGFSLHFEDVLGWVMRNVNPNFFKSLIAVEKARVMNSMNKGDVTRWVAIGIMFIFIAVGIAILVSQKIISF